MRCPYCGQKADNLTYKVIAGYYDQKQEFFIPARSLVEAEKMALSSAIRFVHPKSEIISSELAIPLGE